MVHKIEVPGTDPGAAPVEPGESGVPHQFGLNAAMALIVGSIIGVGIFNLPTSLAAYGPITLVSMALTTVGALALALLFAALSRRLPADGGPYAYARVAFGNRLGFANAWSYWITAWAGNAAIAVGWVLYVEHFINTGHNRFFSVLLVLVGLWIPAAINLSGVKNIGSVQVITTVIKFVVLAFMATVGLFYISTANFTPWNVSGESTITAIGGGMAIALFSYLGVETVAVAAAKVRNPDRNIPRATVLGTIATAIVYMLSLTVVFGIVPTSQLADATAPFSDAVNAMFGGTWAGNVMAIAVIISGFGALNGWTMICRLCRPGDPHRVRGGHAGEYGPVAAGAVGLSAAARDRLERGADLLRLPRLRHHHLHRQGPPRAVAPVASGDVPGAGYRNGHLRRHCAGRVRHAHGGEGDLVRRYRAGRGRRADARHGRLLLMSVTALFATAGATNAGLYPAIGLSERLAETGQFPPLMARRFGGRVSAGLLFEAAACLILAAVFKLDSIASIGSAVALVIFTLITAAHFRVRAETGARAVILAIAIAAAAVVLATFVFTTLIHEPASIVALLAILALSIALDFWWKRARAGRSKQVPVGG
jgi:amino acid transporter